MAPKLAKDPKEPKAKASDFLYMFALDPQNHKTRAEYTVKKSNFKHLNDKASKKDKPGSKEEHLKIDDMMSKAFS
jgi:hypothetical protein